MEVRIMALFFSEQTNRVDKKGRVSVPAQFRSALGEALTLGVAAFPAFSLDKEAIEVWPIARLEQLQDSLDRNYDRFSEDQKSLALLILQRPDNCPLTTRAVSCCPKSY